MGKPVNPAVSVLALAALAMVVTSLSPGEILDYHQRLFALQEIAGCAKAPNLRTGWKLGFRAIDDALSPKMGRR